MVGDEGPREEAPQILAPHEVDVRSVDYTIVIPTRGRWKPVKDISHLRRDKQDRRPFVLVKTLGFLQRQGVAPSRVELWTANAEEAERYQSVLAQDAYWGTGEAQVRIGVAGIMAQRNHIVRAHASNKYLVSLDDDVADVLWKNKGGNSRLAQLPAGAFEKIIFHAYGSMVKTKAFIWGLATTCGRNVLSMSLDGISTRNGEINGFFYGWLNRHDQSLLPCISDATEDAERSLRFFAKDKIVLRYRMYCADTLVWKFSGGLQDQFSGTSLAEKNMERKAAERIAAQQLHTKFGTLTLPPKEKVADSTLNVRFRPLGKFPLPTTTAAALKAANKADDEARELQQRQRQKAQSSAAASSSSSSAAGAAAAAFFGDAVRGGIVEVPAEPDEDREAALAPSCVVQGDSEDNESGSDEADHDALSEAAAENADFQVVVASASASSSAASAGRGGGSARGEVAPMSQAEEEEMLRRALEASMEDLAIQINGECEGDPLEIAMRESEAMAQAAKRRKVRTPVDALLDMGFPSKDAEQALYDAEGDVNVAAVILASAAACAG